MDVALSENKIHLHYQKIYIAFPPSGSLSQGTGPTPTTRGRLHDPTAYGKETPERVSKINKIRKRNMQKMKDKVKTHTTKNEE